MEFFFRVELKHEFTELFPVEVPDLFEPNRGFADEICAV